MSRVKVSVFVIGLIAVVAIAFMGASSFVSSSAKDAGSSAAGEKGCAVSSSCPMSKTDCAKTCGGKSTKTAKIETIGEREGKTVVLSGRYVCGTCDLGVAGDGECQPAFKTKDGKNYLLSKNDLSEKLRADARDKDVEIESRVKKLDGKKCLEVEAIRAAS